MSLLLDALKKAAQDKQKAKDLDKEGIQSPAKGEETAMEAEKIVEPPIESPSEDPEIDPGINPDINRLHEKSVVEDTEAEDLSLALETAFEEQQEGVASNDREDSQQDDQVSAQQKNSETDKPAVDAPLELEKIGTSTSSSVSDEALQLLIYKTNKEYRRSQKILWTGVLSAALILLVAGGFYYYNSMLEEVESLEIKHKLAMRAVKEQPVGARTTAQVRPVVTSPPQPVQQAPQTKKASTKQKATGATQQSQQKNTRAVKPVAASTFSVQRTEKRDKVGDLLNKAWYAYKEQDYATARSAYSKVLKREPLNRDAWMGEAAIAVKKGEYERARAAYSRLLELDPRDEIATAGLANLDETNIDTLSESKLKFMLKQQPDAAHIHFALGNFYARQKKWHEAQGAYFKAWQGDSRNADYVFNLAVSLDQIGKYQDAVRFYRSCLELAEGQNISFSVQAVNDRLSRTAQR